MRKILLLLILAVSSVFAQAQDVDGSNLRIYKNASIGEDGVIYPLDVNGNRIINGGDPINPQDYVTLKYFQDSAVVGDRPYVDFEVNETNPIYKQARLWYDSLRAEMVFYDRVTDLKFGTVGEVSIRVLNNSGVEIAKGKAVYPNGSSGGFTTIGLAKADAYATSRPVGFAKNTMINGAEGWVMLKGVLEDVNTSLLSGGVVYLSPTIAGDLTNTLPSGGDFIIRMGAVGAVGVSDGIINVDPFTNEYTAEAISPRGWPSDVVASTILAPISGSRTFNIIGTGYVYENGIKYAFDNPSVIWDDIEGTVDVYFDEGILTFANNQTESQVRDIYSSKPGASRIYWDALNDTIIFANDMRHTFDMNGNTWATFWDLHKCVVLDGLGLVDIQTEGTGNVDADAQFGHGSGVIRNQDIITSIPAVASTTGYTVFYREGTTEWRSENSIGFPVLTTGTGRVAWNEDVAGTWQQTEVANGDFVLYHLFVSNTLGDKTGTVMGQNDYASLAGARSGALTEIQDLLFSQFPIEELSPVATVIFETRLNYTNGVQARTRQSTDPVTGDLVDYIDWTKTDVSGGGGGGTGANSFDDLSDTPSVKTGSAGLGIIVNPTEDALIYAEIARTINGQSPTAGNYNITSTANKIGEDVTIGTDGTGVDAVFSVADNDADPDNENQDLGNSKLNNDVTVTISNGTNTTITNIARTDFLNPILNTSSLQTSGVERINSSGNITAGSGRFTDYVRLSSSGSGIGNRLALGKSNDINIFTGIEVEHGIDDDRQGLNFYTHSSSTSTDNHVLAMVLGGINTIQNVELNYNGIKKFETTSTGTETTGNSVVSGTITATNVFKVATQTLSGTTPTYNTSTSVNAKITLTGNTTMTLTNLVDGMSGNVRVDNGTGGFTLTVSPTPDVINGGAGVVTLTGTASAVDIISWWYDGTNLNVTYGLNYN